MTRKPSSLPRFLVLYAALFAAFGVSSPFFAAFLGSRGLSSEGIGIVLAAGTAIRLLAGPIGGRLADRLGAPRLVLMAYAAAASCVAFLYLPAEGLWFLLAINIVHASVLAPLTPIADALTVEAASVGKRFQYGWVRGAGSAVFILGTLLSGQIVGRFGLVAIIWLNATLFGATALSVWFVPDMLRRAKPVVRERMTGRLPVSARAAWHRALGWRAAAREINNIPARAPSTEGSALAQTGIRSLLHLPSFRRLMIVAALVQGSHAMHDSFVVIHWRSVGISDGTIGLLWSEAVAAEVVVFLFAGRWLLDRLSPAGASILAAAGGIVRWVVLAQGTSAAAFGLVEPLHGLTFALQHLACMRLIAIVVPPHLAATAQAFYGTVAVGAATALLTLASGPLFAHLGAGGFWLMAGLCAAAVPVALGLRHPATVDRPVIET